MIQSIKDMKKFIYIFIAIIIGITFTSCERSEKKVMEKALAESVSPRSFTDFQVYKTITLGEEVNDQIKLHNFYLNWHTTGVECFEEVVTGYYQLKFREYNLERLAYHKEATKKDKLMLDYLNKLDPNTFNDITFTIYKLTYMYIDDNGDRQLELCFGKFNNSGELVAFKSSSKAKWNILGDISSIPNIYGTKL